MEEVQDVQDVSDNAEIEVKQDSERQEDNKPAGYHPVDLKDLPDDIRKPIEDRLKYMYGQIKTNERTLNEYRGIAKTQSQQIDELMNGVGKVVDHLQERDSASTEASLRKEMREAFELGDNDRYLEIQEKLLDIKANKLTKKSTPEKKQSLPQAREIAEEGVSNGELSEQELSIFSAWQEEVDETGVQLRPWAFDRSPLLGRTDTKYLAALREAAAVLENPTYANWTFDKKLAEIDRRMGVTKSTPRQAVMGANLTSGQNKGKLTLTPQQHKIAVQTKFAGPKATDAEHLEAYRKQIERVQSKKGAK